MRKKGVVRERKNILIVEDEKKTQEMYKKALEGKGVCIFPTTNINDAIMTFLMNSGIGLIVMDACVPGNSTNTLFLTKKIREEFSGPIIAASNNSGFRERLREAGCDYSAEKNTVAELIMRIL